MAKRAQAGEADLGADLRQHYLPLVRAIRACPKPVIAAINGVAAGAGLSLALACDLRLCADDARLSVAFVRIGLVPDAGGLFFLSRLCGLGKAMELALTGEAVEAAEAMRIGLVNAVVPAARLLPAALERARAFAAGPAQTYALIKRGLERALSLDLEEALELEAQLQTLAGKTADHQEAVLAFNDKRQPVFSSRARS
jgi:2-(1,2-epoxy-1,2-dihydrophenyl)acetyl-CoA isomerase